MVKVIQQILTGQYFALENPCYIASGTLETKYKALVISIKVYKSGAKVNFFLQMAKKKYKKLFKSRNTHER